MTVLTFYGKPACQTNRRQKALLRKAGIALEEVDLLAHPWREDELADFFRGTAVREWFNPSAPLLKSGEVDTESLSAAQALRLLAADPVLIRRPLLEYRGVRMAGFDMTRVQQLLGVSLVSASDAASGSVDQCSRPQASEGCR
ncbi:ArsC/Spx/MgsR family protein [Haliea sp. E17]|uniref:ArsC/Spx/MgsR family protein n=1 Tax=Haliea sp. E17 TaxID=3401576 RepID=UPI003AAF64A9